jgi:hypothetical protein
MTDQPSQPPSPPSAPPPPPRQPGIIERLGCDVEHLLPGHGAAAGSAVSADVQALLRGHSATLIRSVADILEAEFPGAEQVASRVLEVALGIAKAAGITL